MRRRLLLLVLAALAATGCGTFVDPGPEQSEERTIEEVTAVELATSGDLVLRPGDTPSLQVVAGENVLGHLTTEVRDGRLVLDDDGAVQSLGEVRFDVVLPAVRTLRVSGSGSADVRAPSVLGQIELSGSGDIGAEGLTTGELTVDVSGSGTVSIAGEATRQAVSVSGSGTYDGAGLSCDEATVSVSGSGTADVTVASTLEAVVEGSGTITYAGDPAVDSRVEGSGSIGPR